MITSQLSGNTGMMVSGSNIEILYLEKKLYILVFSSRRRSHRTLYAHMLTINNLFAGSLMSKLPTRCFSSVDTFTVRGYLQTVFY
jgi:hypothetical protein